MKQELIFIAIAAFLGMNIYHDGKYTKMIMGWKKQFKIAGLCMFLFFMYLFMKKYPNDYRNLLGHVNGMIKFLPIDKQSADMISPLFTSNNKAPPPVALKVSIAIFNSLLIIYCILLSKVNFKG